MSYYYTRKPAKKKSHPESEEQIRFVAFCMKHPILCEILAIENERKCSIFAGQRRKAMGVKAGTSDLFLPIPASGKHGMWIEMKSEKGKLNENQRQFLSKMSSFGYHAVVCYSASQAIEAVLAYIQQSSC